MGKKNNEKPNACGWCLLIFALLNFSSGLVIFFTEDVGGGLGQIFASVFIGILAFTYCGRNSDVVEVHYHHEGFYAQSPPYAGGPPHPPSYAHPGVPPYAQPPYAHHGVSPYGQPPYAHHGAPPYAQPVAPHPRIPPFNPEYEKHAGLLKGFDMRIA